MFTTQLMPHNTHYSGSVKTIGDIQVSIRVYTLEAGLHREVQITTQLVDW